MSDPLTSMNSSSSPVGSGFAMRSLGGFIPYNAGNSQANNVGAPGYTPTKDNPFYYWNNNASAGGNIPANGSNPPVAIDRTFNINGDTGTNTNTNSNPITWANNGGVTNGSPVGPLDPGFGGGTTMNANSNDWLNFRFDSATKDPFEQNFNYLAGIDPNLAFAYGLTSPNLVFSGNQNTLSRALNDRYGYGTGQSLINIFNNDSGRPDLWGLGAGYQAPRFSMDPGGQYLTWNGKQYNLPNLMNTGQLTSWANPELSANWSPVQQAIAAQNAAAIAAQSQAQIDASAGSDAWWHALGY